MQRARNRSCRHHQHIGGNFALALQLHALMHPEPVLFVHHGKPEIAKPDIFGKNCMRADQDVDFTFGKIATNVAARGARVPVRSAVRCERLRPAPLV